MSEAKFTKGDWFIDKESCWCRDSWSLSVKRDSDGSTHHCFATVVYKMENELENKELESNAHLIAAAPEMYEAMQEFVNRVDRGEVRSTATYNKFKTILAKARGEA